jgi:hypothetical protein
MSRDQSLKVVFPQIERSLRAYFPYQQMISMVVVVWTDISATSLLLSVFEFSNNS